MPRRTTAVGWALVAALRRRSWLGDDAEAVAIAAQQCRSRLHLHCAIEERDADQAERVEAEKDNHHATDPPDVALRRLDIREELADGDAEECEDRREAEDERDAIEHEHPAHAARALRDRRAREIADIARHERQHARRHKREQPAEKGERYPENEWRTLHANIQDEQTRANLHQSRTHPPV